MQWAGRLSEPGPLATWFGCMVSQHAMREPMTRGEMMRVLEQIDAEIESLASRLREAEGAE